MTTPTLDVTSGLVPAEALHALMPMHLVLEADGRIAQAGATIPVLFPDVQATDLVGQSFFELFEVRRPRVAAKIQDLITADRGRLKVVPRRKEGTPLKGLAIELPQKSGALINFSFGIFGIEAIQRYSLTAGDFSYTDQTIELLYLQEANTAAMAEGKRLNQRLHLAHAAAERRALTDALTGLKNRRALEHSLSRLITDREEFTLVHMDLDKFKFVNDTYGHAAGDQVLQVVASRLNTIVRGTDLVARMGGDEFVLILRQTTGRSQLSPVCGRIIEGLERPIPFGDANLQISCSIGLAISTHYEVPNPETMQHEADMALYESKRTGRGRFTFYCDLDPAALTPPPDKSEEER